MEGFRLPPATLPTRFYRVHYPSSHTTFTNFRGFSASDTQTFYPHDAQQALFFQSLRCHSKWSDSTPSPYISVFSDKRHAENWALEWSRNNSCVGCEVFEIDSSSLGNVYVFSVARMSWQLQARPSELVDRLDPDEYLCLHRIPAEAVVGCRGTMEIEGGGSTI
jgi:hypothetical protein